MTTTSTKPDGAPDAAERPVPLAPWLRLLAWLTGIVAVADLVHFAVIAHVIPPLAVGAVLTAVGLVLLRRRPRAGIILLGVTSVILLLGGLGFAVDHLQHPESGVDFTLGVVGTIGRILAIAAAIGAWRGAAPAGARRLGTLAVGLAAATVLVATVATASSTGSSQEAGDVVVGVRASVFPDTIQVASGGTVFVDNADVLRHTFTVEGTDIDAEVPLKQGVRVPIDLPAGTYSVICAVPGHELMTSQMEVR